VKIQKSISALVIFLYIVIIFFTPPSYIDRPKYLLVSILRFPLSITNNIFYSLSNLLHSRQIIQENVELRRKLDDIKQKLTQYKETEAENERLRSLLAFKQRSSFKLIAARIIGRDSSNLSDTILIDQGESTGVKKDTVVIGEAGLIGRVSSSSSGTSRVEMITDPNSRVSAVVVRSRQTGVVYGTSTRLCELRYIPLEADIEIGDEVATSGFSDIYPKGILIGKVIRIKQGPRGLSLTALVEPAVDLSRMEELLCIE
jgi:rod shape-determining protein MreC